MSEGQQLRMKDDEGNWVGAGDTIVFSFGIPPLRVEAPVVERDGSLVALTPGCRPKDCKLRALRRHVGYFRKLQS